MIHVLFSASAAGILRRSLHAKRQRLRVIDLSENLDWGPIAIKKLVDREDWLNRNVPLIHGPWNWLADCETRFRQAVAADPDHLIWIAPRSASEQAGLLWYLDQFGTSAAQMIIADHPVRNSWNGEAPQSLGELNQDQMTELLEEAPRVDWDASRFPAERWQQLVVEDALVRVVDDGKLRSASEDFFDRFLVQHCANGWTKWHRVVGDAMISSWDAGHRPDSYLLTWRLRDLIQRGEIECDGELPHPDSGSSNAAKVRAT